jgi:hypothetical protein
MAGEWHKVNTKHMISLVKCMTNSTKSLSDLIPVTELQPLKYTLFLKHNLTY